MTPTTDAERSKVFAWLPQNVYSGPFMRDGFGWLCWLWRDGAGRHYRSAK